MTDAMDFVQEFGLDVFTVFGIQSGFAKMSDLEEEQPVFRSKTQFSG